MTSKSSNEGFLEPNYKTTGDIVLKRQDTLRQLVGILGITLPICLYLFLQIDSGFSSVLPSISHYYYTRACGIFIISVSALAIFLLIYKGEDTVDFYASVIAGFSALCVLLFPTDDLASLSGGKYVTVNVTDLKDSDFRKGFHYLSAAIFLLSLTYMALFLFTRSALPPSKRPKAKIIRNRIYRVCAATMLGALIVIFLGYLGFIPEDYYNTYCLTFWMEVLAVEAFGFAWMVKGKAFFTDRP
ncbi:DUF998 domain-containing protein [Spirosoma daeguense]